MFCRVGVPFSLQLSHAVRNVKNAGNKREKSSTDHDVEQGNKVKLQHHPSNCDHLRNSCDFPRPPWFHLYFAVEQIQHHRTDEDDGIARDDKNGEPCWKSSIIGINFAPVADAQCDNGAQKQAFVSNRIENDSERTPLIVAARDVSVQTIAHGSQQENADGWKTLALQRHAPLNTSTIIYRPR